MAIELRDYQQRCLDGFLNYFTLHKGNPLVVVPTGGG